MTLVPVSPSALHPGTFDDFLRSWKKVELASQDTVLSDQCLDTDESILKLSQAVKSDLGFGCIGLTHKRSVHRETAEPHFTYILKIQPPHS